MEEVDDRMDAVGVFRPGADRRRKSASSSVGESPRLDGNASALRTSFCDDFGYAFVHPIRGVVLRGREPEQPQRLGVIDIDTFSIPVKFAQ
ncbi:MAG TPA: hypothetical protein VIZ90_18760, partial [Rhizobiaceae bacterium]